MQAAALLTASVAWTPVCSDVEAGPFPERDVAACGDGERAPGGGETGGSQFGVVSVEDVPPLLTGWATTEPAIGREENAVMRPIWADDLNGPPVLGGGVEAAAEQAGDPNLGAGKWTESRTGQVGASWRAVIKVGVVVAGESLPRGGIEDAVTAAGDDHQEVVSAGGVDPEADSE
ncbi:hypothetical protein GCM10010341_85110 [Streptomyces noursei]|nr:hypothetical protein GCM10010341_85110 [Streptomyces noursei]